MMRSLIQFGLTAMAVVCSGVALASPWPIQPHQVGEPYDPPPPGKLSPSFPHGSRNLALAKPVTSSSAMPIIGTLDLVTDDDRMDGGGSTGGTIFDDGHFVELESGKQFVQIDLLERAAIDGVWLWHRHRMEAFDVPLDVVVQIASDVDFKGKVYTIYNNDRDGSLGFGRGLDWRYATSRYGKLVYAKGAPGRYVRVWSAGSARNTYSCYTEVEVWGRPKLAAGWGGWLVPMMLVGLGLAGECWRRYR